MTTLHSFLLLGAPDVHSTEMACVQRSAEQREGTFRSPSSQPVRPNSRGSASERAGTDSARGHGVRVRHEGVHDRAIMVQCPRFPDFLAALTQRIHRKLVDKTCVRPNTRP